MRDECSNLIKSR